MAPGSNKPLALLRIPLEQWFSEHGPGTSSSPGAFVRNEEPCTLPQT